VAAKAIITYPDGIARDPEPKQGALAGASGCRTHPCGTKDILVRGAIAAAEILVWQTSVISGRRTSLSRLSHDDGFQGVNFVCTTLERYRFRLNR
jgi:hypothetical protein